MQTAKQILLFRHFSYDIELAPISEKRLTITVTDSSSKTEFFEKDLTLENIGVSTVIKAFQKIKKELSFQIETKKGGQNEMVQIKIKVQSQFLLPVQEVIYINKLREINESEALEKSIVYLNKRMKDLHSCQEINRSSQVLMASKLQDQHFSAGGGAFQTFSEIILPQGKYIITWTFLAKATKLLMYIYLNQNTLPLLANCRIYVPNQNEYSPFTFRKVHTVTNISQTIQLQTYNTNRYPTSIKNCIVTAKRFD